MAYFIIFIVTMAILSYFNQNKKPSTTSIVVQDDYIEPVAAQYQTDYYSGFNVDEEYIEILLRRPQYYFFIDGDYSYAYTDQYKTDEGYKLRELLLLVWWGKVKKGRDVNTKIPRYFYERYHINPNITTKTFIDHNLIYCDDSNIVRFTDRGNEIKNKYSVLWEIHSTKNYYANLDNDFPNWDANKFLIKKNYQKIAYEKAMANWYREILEFLNRKYPKEIEQIDYHRDLVNHHLYQINKLESEINALL